MPGTVCCDTAHKYACRVLVVCLLRCAQIKNGAHFISETDTEVIPKLLKFAYDNWEGERLPFPKVSARQRYGSVTSSSLLMAHVFGAQHLAVRSTLSAGHVHIRSSQPSVIRRCDPLAVVMYHHHTYHGYKIK
jgi:hypothetical protein